MALKIISIVILIAICASIAFGVDVLWNKIDESNYPQEYSEYVTEYSIKYNIPEYIIYAVIKVESDFDSNAVSSAEARGLMQMIEPIFMWITGGEHLNENLAFNAAYLPDVNIRYGTYYLSYLYKKFNCNWDTALAAYNAGETRVSEWLKDPEYSDGNGNLTNIPYSETRNYVKKVNSAIEKYKKLYYEGNEGVCA